MEKEDIRIVNTIIHILNSNIEMPVLSDAVLDHGSALEDFLRTHIKRIITGDDIKSCSFIKEESKVYKLLKDWDEEDFVVISQEIGKILYAIMNENIEIPPADLMVVTYTIEQHPYMALLKMNYKTAYTHMTNESSQGNNNDIINQKAILPGETHKITEAAIINMKDFTISLIEKKYNVNGIKTNYFSSLFLKCEGTISAKKKLEIISRMVENVQNKYYNESEQFEVRMETKNIINQELEEKGSLEILPVIDKIFKEKQDLKEEVQEKIEKCNITKEPVILQNPITTKKFGKQHLITDTGIEIKIPMEEYNNKNAVEFITNEDGTITIRIKNISHIESR